MYTSISELIKINESYHQDWHVTQDDVDKVNKTIDAIEKRIAKPTDGDSVVIIEQSEDGKRVRYYQAHLQRPWCDDDFSVCEQPYTPFVTLKENSEIATDASGGAWFGVKNNDLMYAGKTKKLFCVWGHGGGRANGAVDFYAQVNNWIVFVDKQGKVIPPSTQEKTVKLEVMNGNGMYYTKPTPLHIVIQQSQLSDTMINHIREYTKGLTFKKNNSFNGWYTATPEDTAQVVRFLTMASTYKMIITYTDNWNASNTLYVTYGDRS